MLAFDALSVDFNGLAIEDFGPAMDDLDPVLFQQRADAAGQAINDGVFPLHALADIEGRGLGLDPQR